jgi:hypothetical protein
MVDYESRGAADDPPPSSIQRRDQRAVAIICGILRTRFELPALGAPVMAAAMVFELSGDYAIVLPLLVATATATLLSKRLRPDSVYGEELRRKGMAWDITIEGRRVRQTGSEAKPPPAGQC